jgi:hypothetical protein
MRTGEASQATGKPHLGPPDAGQSCQAFVDEGAGEVFEVTAGGIGEVLYSLRLRPWRSPGW